MRNDDVVIVDYDCMTPLGLTFDSTWKELINNRSGITAIDRYDPSNEPLRGVSSVAYGGQLPVSYEVLAGSDSLYKKSSEPAYHAVKTVCKRILERIRFNISDHNPQRIAILGGTAFTSQISHDWVAKTGKPYVYFMLNQCHNIPLSVAAKEFGMKGPSFSVSGACASSGHAVFLGAHLIRTGLIDCALIAGFEFPILPICVAGFTWLNTLYTRDDPTDRAYDMPVAASRPFSKDRRGFLLAEGVGAVLICNAEYATAMGWPMKGSIRGGYMNSDGDHLTQTSSDNIAFCMRTAMELAQCSPEDIGCINAHATSTTVGDEAELQALYQVFGHRLMNIPIVANKSQLGHSLGASSILSLILAVEGMRERVILPTLNYVPDPCLPEAWIPAGCLEHSHNLTLLNSFGFGGTNVSFVVGILPPG